MTTTARPPRRTPVASPVQVRPLSHPRPGWTIEQAVDQLARGYRPEQVVRLTGFHPDHLRAAARAAAKE